MAEVLAAEVDLDPSWAKRGERLLAFLSGHP